MPSVPPIESPPPSPPFFDESSMANELDARINRQKIVLMLGLLSDAVFDENMRRRGRIESGDDDLGINRHAAELAVNRNPVHGDMHHGTGYRRSQIHARRVGPGRMMDRISTGRTDHVYRIGYPDAGHAVSARLGRTPIVIRPETDLRFQSTKVQSPRLVVTGHDSR